mgnify:CR=1 FL=1
MPTYTTSVTFGYKLKPNLFVLSNTLPPVQYRPIKNKLFLPVGQASSTQSTPKPITTVNVAAIGISSSFGLACFHPETLVELQNKKRSIASMALS